MAYIPDGNGVLEIHDADGGKHRILIATRVGYTAATAGVRTRTSLTRQPLVSVSLPGSGQFGFDYEPHPGMMGDRVLEKHHRDGTIADATWTRGEAAERTATGAGEDINWPASATDAVFVDATGLGFGSDDNPSAKWLPGYGIVVGSILYIIMQVIDDTTLRIVKYGDIASGLATEDEDRSITLKGANTDYSVVQMAVQETYSGRVSQAGGDESSGDGEVASSASLELITDRGVKLMVP